ncbi:MAG: HD domain-containing protein [Bryobacterales bacterium]|nr:HD domain-containing protein [Bryobacterales bacterium]
MDPKPTLEDAIILAATAHRGQVDKAGEPYILHPLRVMLQLEDQAGRIAAALHDVLEDTATTADNLRDWGYGEEVIEALEALTKREGEGYADFIERVAPNPLARRVKLADLADNMNVRRLRVVGDADRARLARYQAARQRLQVGTEAPSTP